MALARPAGLLCVLARLPLMAGVAVLTGWALAALSGGLVVVTAAAISVLTLTTTAVQVVIFEDFLVLGIVLALPAVLLFLAFALGLPSTATTQIDASPAPISNDAAS